MRTKRALKTFLAAPVAIPVLIVGILSVLVHLLSGLVVAFLDKLMNRIDNWVER